MLKIKRFSGFSTLLPSIFGTQRSQVQILPPRLPEIEQVGRRFHF
jgi:hypothetical protein